MPQDPLISVLIPTRDRPRLLGLALQYYNYQSYPKKELIVIDDGELFPVDAAAVEAVGGRLIRVPTGTPTGTKLNAGAEQARGTFCQRMDDDDYYAPEFMERMIAGALEHQEDVCIPTLSFLLPFLFFEVPTWEIRQSQRGNAPGGTMLFSRNVWESRPFRPMTIDEDVWFFADLRRWGAEVVPVRATEYYLAVRHRGFTGERGHVWTRQQTGQEVETYLKDRPIHNRRPEDMLPEFALEVYRDLRRQIGM
jgi:glycosyltransferase involved in cell wall biosynthesis